MSIPEPHTSAVVAAAGGLSLVAGTIFGLPVAAVFFGFIGGLAALKMDQSQRGIFQRVTTVALGTVCAAASAHPVAEVLHPANTPTAMWIPIAAIVIGAGAEVLLRMGLRAAANRLRQIGGIQQGGDPW